MKRYSLCAYDSKTKSEFLMGINVDKKGIYVISGEKSLLSAIDLYSMKFGEEKNLIFDLLNVGILSSDAKLYIRYENNGLKKTSILYKDADQMLPFAKELATNVDINTNYFNEFINRLIKASKNEKFMKYMQKYGYINDYLCVRLNEYKNGTYADLDLLMQKIATAAAPYKVIRDIYIGTQRYKRGESIPNFESIQLPKMYVNNENDLSEEEKYQLDLYLHGGEDELYSIFDNEQVTDKVRKKIREYHKEGL